MTFTVEQLRNQFDLEDRQILLLQSVTGRLPLCAVLSRQDVLCAVPKDDTYQAIAIEQGARVSVIEDNWMTALPTAIETWLKELHATALPQKTTLLDGTKVQYFPVVDNGGKVMAALLFLGSEEEAELEVLADTANYIATNGESLHFGHLPSHYDGMLLVESDGTIISANETAYHLSTLMGLDRRLVGTSIHGYIRREDWLDSWQGRRVQVKERLRGDMVFSETIAPVFRVGKTPRIFLIWEDKTKVQQAERALLVQHSVLKEMHHRIKNDLQMVAGMLRMQSRRATDEFVKESLLEGVHRIESLALVHDTLSYYKGEEVSLETLVQRLATSLGKSYLPTEAKVLISFEGDNLWLSAEEGGYLSMVLNELLTNALLHGILPSWRQSPDEQYEVTIQGIKGEELRRIEVVDNGKGLRPDWERESVHRLGVQIVKNIVEEQLRGTFTLSPRDGGGVKATLEWR